MKKLLLISIAIGYSLIINPIFSQNYQNNGQLGLPGDNLNLYGVLSIFQESKTLEEFEQKLNLEDSKINNLDLDADGRTDYIKVIDNVNGSSHVIVLRDILTANESQDVAVIEVEKDRNNQIQIQIIGDEALYGRNYIVEPAYGTPNPGYKGNNNTTSGGNVYEYNNYYTTSNVGYGSNYIYSIGAWSIIHYIFAPNYVVYNSPWSYGYYPHYWRPWRTVYYHDYYGHWHNHHSYKHFRHTKTYSVPSAHTYYGPRRTVSTNVHNRIEKGEYKKTYDSPNKNAVNNNRTLNNNNQKNTNEQYNNTNKRISNERTTTTNPTYNNTNERGGRRTEAKTNTNTNERSARRTETKANTNTNTNTNERPVRKTETRSTTNDRPASRSTTKPAEKKAESKGSEKRR